MASLSADSLHLAGFALAHAAWSVADTPPGDLLCPLAVIQDGDEHRLVRFEAETQQAAIQTAKAAMREWQEAGSSFALVREGQWRPGGADTEPEDVLTVDFWAPGMDAPQTAVQAFRRGNGGATFAIRPLPQLVIGGRLVPDQDAQSAIAVMLEGVQSHPAVADLWPTWRGDHPSHDA